MKILKKLKKSGKPVSGSWIITNYNYRGIGKEELYHCSKCGMPNPRPAGNYCRWCGAHMTGIPFHVVEKE